MSIDRSASLLDESTIGLQNYDEVATKTSDDYSRLSGGSTVGADSTLSAGIKTSAASSNQIGGPKEELYAYLPIYA